MTTNSVDKILLTAREAAPLLSIAERTLLALAQKDLVPHVRIGLGSERKLVRFNREDLQAWAKQQTQGLECSE